MERQCSPLEHFLRRCWSSSLYFQVYRRLHPDYPFFTPRATKTIEDLIDKNSNVFEWGSGASTIWFARHVKNLISVEHDRIWYEKGIADLKKEKLDNVNLIFSPPVVPPSNYSWHNDWKYYNILGHPPLKPQFKAYIEAIDEYPDTHFDCIVIDGRERVGCVLHAIPKLAEDGFIVLDDSARPQYAEFYKILQSWNVRKFDFGLLQTTLFFR